MQIREERVWPRKGENIERYKVRGTIVNKRIVRERIRKRENIERFKGREGNVYKRRECDNKEER